jgi:1,4-alpha-glucan branching enzyme
MIYLGKLLSYRFCIAAHTFFNQNMPLAHFFLYRYYFNIVKKSLPDTKGYLQIVLHAHLPYICYPEHEHHLEENWLYEAITETYIPLLALSSKLLNDNVPFRITLSLSPTLIEMFNNPLLRARTQKYIERLIELSEKEMFRTRRDRKFKLIIRMYNEKYREILHLYTDVYKKDLTSAFVSLSHTRNVEIIPSAATHAYLPALMIEPIAVKAQLRIADDYFRNTFGMPSSGIWLPECGYAPGIDAFVKEAGFNYVFLESHSLLNSIPRSRHSIYAPVRTPSDTVCFARDAESSKQVWSSREGYPGDPDYRDFYRDIGFDLDLAYVAPYLPGGIRTFTGLKYYRITGKSDNKKPYDIKRAQEKITAHAVHFVKSRRKQVLSLHKKLGIKPLITAAYDAELFGHWWFEGPEWLEAILRKGTDKRSVFKFVTPTEYLSRHKKIEVVMPSISSWGHRGYSSTWIDASNSWIYKPLHRAARLMAEMASSNLQAKGLRKRALTQAARELLLAQASDWPFMMKTGNAYDFATNKFKEHMNNFYALHNEILLKNINGKNLASLEKRNSLFPDLDYRVYSR